MKKILLFFAAAVCAIASWAQDATVSATVTGEELTVALTNPSEDFVAFQMDITLPEGVTVANTGAITMATDRLTQPDKPASFDASETVDFKVAYNVLSGNVVRVIAYNLENRAIVGKEGDLFTVALNGTSEEGYAVNNVLFVKESDLTEATLAATVKVESGEISTDVNKDGKFDLKDVTALLMMYVQDDPYVLKEVDFSGDGKFDLKDVTALLNIYVSE